jgi:hypothetical protein
MTNVPLMTAALLTSNIRVVRRTSELAASWPPVPPEAVSWMPPELDSLAEAMAAAIVREVPGYALADDGSRRIMRRVARDAAGEFAARIADPVTPREATALMFRDIGRAEAARGRGLDALHAALRVGARVTWQRLQEKARQGTGDVEVFACIGVAIFRYLDELADACSAGYAEAKAEFDGTVEQLRRRLLGMLLSDPPAPESAVASVARAAGWRLPRRVAAVAFADQVRSIRGPFPAGVLADLTRRDPCLLVPDPDMPSRLRLLEDSLRSRTAARPAGCLAAVGPAVPLARAGSSLRWARQALTLACRGIVGGADGIVRCDEHMTTLLLLADTELAGMLSRQLLAPLRRVRPDQADRLAETLLAWLDSADDASAAARLLHVHPQTVRYRLRQLRGLFGDVLGDPDARFGLQLALRVRRLRQLV